MAIDNAGQIAGGSLDLKDGGTGRGFIWLAQSGMKEIGSPVGLDFVNPISMNQQGQVFGTTGTGGFIYSTTSGLQQPTVPGTTVGAVYALNGHGQMVIPNVDNGYIGDLLYTPGQPLVSIESASHIPVSIVAGLNDQGTVTGIYNTTPLPHAFIWNQATGLTDLTPEKDVRSWAFGINDLNQVVGGAMVDGGAAFPFLYDSGTLYNLTDLLGADGKGWTQLTPEAINNLGQIAGYGYFDGQVQAFLMTPSASAASAVPEPTTLGVLAAGAAATIGRRRRRG